MYCSDIHLYIRLYILSIDVAPCILSVDYIIRKVKSAVNTLVDDVVDCKYKSFNLQSDIMIDLSPDTYFVEI